MRQIIILFAIIPLTVFCQNADTIKAKRISIGLNFSPDYCYRTLKPDAASTNQWIADYRDSMELPRIGFSTGLSFAYKLNKRFSLDAGIQYSDKGEKLKKIEFIYSQPEPDLPTSGSFIYHYIYIDIPIKANYYFLTKRAKLYLSAGISSNIFITQRVIAMLEYEDGQTERHHSANTNGYSKINLAFVAGLGFSYDVTNKLYVKFEPTYRRSITSIIDAPINGYLYSAGLNTALYYKL